MPKLKKYYEQLAKEKKWFIVYLLYRYLATILVCTYMDR
jgi:hypothetical protein